MKKNFWRLVALVACFGLMKAGVGLAEEGVAMVDPSFGLVAGMGLEEVEAVLGPLREVAEGAYLASAPAGAPPEIATLTVFLVPPEGLCRVQATTRPLTSDGRGTSIRDYFSALLERLWASLGEPRVVDTLREGSSLGRQDQWLEALQAGDRVVMSFWGKDTGARLPEGTEAVVLAARPLDGSQGFVMVESTFYNWPGCQSLLEHKKP